MDCSVLDLLTRRFRARIGHSSKAVAARARQLADDNARLREQNCDLEQRVLCVVCCAGERSTMFRCGHVVCCEECARYVVKAKGECPICRTRVQKYARVFLA